MVLQNHNYLFQNPLKDYGELQKFIKKQLEKVLPEKHFKHQSKSCKISFMGEEKNLVGMCFKKRSEVKFNKNLIK